MKGEYEWTNLDKSQKRFFIGRAHSIINGRHKTLQRKYIDGKLNPEVSELAEQLYQGDRQDYDSRYWFPVCARHQISMYDIIIEEDGVKILTGLDDIGSARRVKKALIAFIYAQSQTNNRYDGDNSDAILNEQIKLVDKENVSKLVK